MTANMLPGVDLALKDKALYTAHEKIGHPLALGALEHERLGDLIMWIPGSAACVLAFRVLLRKWDSPEGRLDERRRRRDIPLPAVAACAANYQGARWLALAAFAGFAATLGIGLITTSSSG